MKGAWARGWGKVFEKLSPESKWEPCWLTPGHLSEAAWDPAAPAILPYASTREARRGGEAGVGRSGGGRGGESCSLVPAWASGWETTL